MTTRLHVFRSLLLAAGVLSAVGLGACSSEEEALASDACDRFIEVGCFQPEQREDCVERTLEHLTEEPCVAEQTALVECERQNVDGMRCPTVVRRVEGCEELAEAASTCVDENDL